MFGQRRDTVVKGLSSRALDDLRDGKIIAVVVIGQNRRAVFRQIERAVLQIIDFEREQVGAVPERDECAIERIGVAIVDSLHPQSRGATAGGRRGDNLAVERLSPQVGIGSMLPSHVDRALHHGGIGQRVDAANPGEGLIASDTDFEGESCRGRVAFEFRELLGVDGAESEMNGVAGSGLLGVGDAPSAIVPIAQFHPADIAASWFAVLGEILGGPVASPVFQPESATRGNGLCEIDGDRVDFARIIPHNALPVRQGNAVRRCVKGNWRLVAEERASKSERRQKGKPESGIHGLKLPDRKPWPQHSFRPGGNSGVIKSG